MRKFLCKTHTIDGKHFSFPVYPPGYRPYTRRNLVAISYDGRPVGHEPDGADPALTPVFSGTIFDAALDAARGIAWARAPPPIGYSDTWWPTQGRLLEEHTRLFGLGEDVTERERDEICEILSIERIIHEESRSLLTAPGYRNRGTAISRILKAIAENREGALAILRRLLILGHFRGLWGAPTLWDETANGFIRLTFRRSGTGSPRKRE